MSDTINSTYNGQDGINDRKTNDLLEQLPDFCRSFLINIWPTTSSTTRLAYAHDLCVFISFLREKDPSFFDVDIRAMPASYFDRLEREDLEEYADYLSYYERNGQSYTNENYGKARKLSAVRGLFRYLHTSGIIHKDLESMVHLPERRERSVICLGTEEVRELLSLVDNGEALTNKQRLFHNKTRIRDKAIMITLLGTGILVSELAALNMENVDLEERNLRIPRNGVYDNVVYFGEDVKESLQEYLEQRKGITALEGHENALFLSLQKRRITVRAVENLVKKYAGNMTDQKITPHKLRDTFGMNLFQQTQDIHLVGDILGCKDINRVRRYIGRSDDTRRRAVMNSFSLK